MMGRKWLASWCAVVVFWATFGAGARGQEGESGSPGPTESQGSETETETTDQAASDEDAGVTPLTARVVEVVGDVTQAPVGTSPLDAESWKPVVEEGELSAGTLLRTGIRSRVILLFGEENLVGIKAMTLASINDFYQTEDAKVIRLGLGYGTVRGGSTEGTLRSDLIIDSTQATLAKRGTEGWQIQVEPYTGRFSISLARHGLVEALQKATGQQRRIRPGEYATDLNIGKMWINQAQFDRTVKLVAVESMSTADLDFSTAQSRGIGTVAPGAGSEAVSFARRTPQRDFVVDQVIDPRSGRLTDLQEELSDTTVIEQSIVRLPDGNFGVANTFRILMPENRRGQKRQRLLNPNPSQGDVDRWVTRRSRSKRR